MYSKSVYNYYLIQTMLKDNLIDIALLKKFFESKVNSKTKIDKDFKNSNSNIQLKISPNHQNFIIKDINQIKRNSKMKENFENEDRNLDFKKKVEVESIFVKSRLFIKTEEQNDNELKSEIKKIQNMNEIMFEFNLITEVGFFTHLFSDICKIWNKKLKKIIQIFEKIKDYFELHYYLKFISDVKNSDSDDSYSWLEI